MSERVSSEFAKTLSEITGGSLLYTGEDVINLALDLLDSRARVDALMFNEEISQDVLEQSEASAKAWEEDALLRAKNEAFWRERAERAEARVKELEWFLQEIADGCSMQLHELRGEQR